MGFYSSRLRIKVIGPPIPKLSVSTSSITTTVVFGFLTFANKQFTRLYLDCLNIFWLSCNALLGPEKTVIDSFGGVLCLK